MNETPANEALALLDERKATVLRVRFYEGRTLESLAVQLGISRERVRQTESKAIRAIRFPRIQRKLEAYRENILSGSCIPRYRLQRMERARQRRGTTCRAYRSLCGTRHNKCFYIRCHAHTRMQPRRSVAAIPGA